MTCVLSEFEFNFEIKINCISDERKRTNVIDSNIGGICNNYLEDDDEYVIGVRV